MKLWENIWFSAIALGVSALLIFAMKASENHLKEKKSSFISQCKLDGYKPTDCYVKWKMTH